MLDGKRPSACWKCWHDEDNDKKSMRQSVDESRLEPHIDTIKKMDTNTQHDPSNPINHKESPEDRAAAKNELIRETLSYLSIEYLEEDATFFFNNTEDFTQKQVDEIYDDLTESGFFHVAIIYYSVAMDYLQEHDSSLSESVELATESGYTLKNINSELLASLHASEERRADFFNYVAPELEKIINN